MAKGKLFVISGPSGVGKGTICKEVLNAESSLELSVSMTTRPPREGEINNVHYRFVDHEVFKGLIGENGFMEYASVYGNFYGTPKDQVFDRLERGIDVILEIDVQGAMKIKETYQGGVFIFILPPSIEELKNRIKKRGSETEETLARRAGAAVEEISSVGSYDYSVVNGELQQAVKDVRTIIAAERCRINDDKALHIIERYKEE